MTAPSPLLALARRPLRRAVHDARHVTPVPFGSATGSVRRIYDAVERDFGLLAPPVALHSPAPVVLAAVWRLLRSTLLLPGTTSRAEREAVAAAVSRANRCPYCVEVHDASRDALAAGGHRDLAAWTGGDGPAPRRGADELAELADVAATFEYLNRVVTVFLPESPVPPAAPPAARSGALRLLGSAARRDASGRRTVRAGALLDDVAAAAAAAVPGLGGGVTLAVERALTRTPVGLEDPSADAVVGLGSSVRAPARLAVLAAVAPWRVTRDGIDAARDAIGPADGVLVSVVATGAVAAARSRRAALLASSSAIDIPGEAPTRIAS